MYTVHHASVHIHAHSRAQCANQRRVHPPSLYTSTCTWSGPLIDASKGSKRSWSHKHTPRTHARAHARTLRTPARTHARTHTQKHTHTHKHTQGSVSKRALRGTALSRALVSLSHPDGERGGGGSYTHTHTRYLSTCICTLCSAGRSSLPPSIPLSLPHIYIDIFSHSLIYIYRYILSFSPYPWPP
jgi:hypothetical protein